MQKIILIGAGLAAYTVAREFRKLDQTSQLALITADNGAFYSKPTLSNAFAQKRTPAQLVSQSADQMRAQLGAEILTDTRIERIDLAAKTLHADGASYRYDKLVLALGAQPIRLTLAGNAAARVMSVNHLDDYAAFVAHIDARLAALSARGPVSTVRIAILGAGLIGCEFANDLAGAGYAVTLVGLGSLPLSPPAPEAIARNLRDALEKSGIALRLGVSASAVDAEGAEGAEDTGLAVTLSDGSRIEADLVLSAVGLRPDVALAKEAGLRVERGIVVDQAGCSSDPAVYALGDCAEYSTGLNIRQPLPYVAPLMSAARAIGRTLTGDRTAINFKPMPVLVKTPCYPIALLPPPPHYASQGKWVDEHQGEKTICRFLDAEGRMLGFGVAPHDAAIRQQLIAQLDPGMGG
jgi:rubredoxin---NAD+ reductase